MNKPRKNNVVAITGKAGIGKSLSKEQIERHKNNCVDAYTSHFYRLFPLRDNKEPYAGSETVHTPYNPLWEGSDFKYNYAVVLKADDLVIDVDRKNFAKKLNGVLVHCGGKYKHQPYKGVWAGCKVLDLEEGEIDNPMARLLADVNLPKQPDTYIVRSGGGGYHIHFKVPPGARWETRLADYPGIDFRRAGGYMVGPGSVHPESGWAYYVAHGSLDNILPMPVDLARILRKSDRVAGVGLSGFDMDTGIQKQFVRFLKTFDPAIQGEYGGLVMDQVAKTGFDLAIDPQTAFDLIAEHYNPRCVPEFEENELKKRVESAYRSSRDVVGNRHPRADFDDLELPDEAGPNDELREMERDYQKWNFDRQGQLYPRDPGNTLSYFLDPLVEDKEPNPLYRLIRFNELSQRPEFTRRAPWQYKKGDVPPIDDRQSAMLLMYLSQRSHYISGDGALKAAILTLSVMYTFDPVRDYLNGLVWDGVERLPGFLHKYAGAEDTALNAEIGKNTLLAAVYRVFEPGCQMDTVLILEGRQGSAKSKFVRILGGEFGKTLSIDLNHRKDTVQAMLGGWIFETAEVVFMRKQDANAIKDFITTPVDSARMPYKGTTEDYKRRSIIIGTCNPDEGMGYFNDPTGARRYWPVTTGDLDLDGLRRDRDQLFAEAVVRYHNREQYWLTDETLLAEAAEQQELRQVAQPVAEQVISILENMPVVETISLREVYEKCDLKISSVTPTIRAQVVRGMRVLGYEFKQQNRHSGIFVLTDPLAGLE
jgi:predicted P-loop ATPase